MKISVKQAIQNGFLFLSIINSITQFLQNDPLRSPRAGSAWAFHTFPTLVEMPLCAGCWPQTFVHAITSERLFGFISFLAGLMASSIDSLTRFWLIFFVTLTFNFQGMEEITNSIFDLEDSRKVKVMAKFQLNHCATFPTDQGPDLGKNGVRLGKLSNLVSRRSRVISYVLLYDSIYQSMGIYCRSMVNYLKPRPLVYDFCKHYFTHCSMPMVTFEA